MTETIEYIQTKEVCQENIDKLNYVCRTCGEKLTPIETVDNSNRPTFWSGCVPCSKLDYGVPRIVFDIAKKMVIEEHYVHYSHMEYPSDKKGEEYKNYWIAEQIGGLANLIQRVFSTKKEIEKNSQQ